MIKTRLVGLLSHAKKYIVYTILWQWAALLSQVLAVFSIEDLLERVVYRAVTVPIIERSILSLVLVVGIRFICERMGARSSYLACVDVKRILREKIYEKISEQGYVTYDFFLPGLIIDALESGNGEHLAGWAQELIDKNIRTVNMLGCHDGIPLWELKGILAEDRIQKLIDIIVSRGGYVKDLHGQKNIYYQVNATYFSALGEDERKMLLARA